MIKIETIDVSGFKGAIHGMRNAMNSWDKSDSYMRDCYIREHIDCEGCPYREIDCVEYLHYFRCFIGKADMELAKRLIKAGSSDRKFMRMIHVQANVNAPIYWWKQADQYRIGVTTNSTSTMHTIHKEELTLDDFSHDNLCPSAKAMLENIVYELNYYRAGYLDSKDKDYWWQMIQLLPSSFNQLRTIDLDYETLFSIYYQRKNHKLDEWREFCKWILTLPYMSDFIDVDTRL